MRLRYIPLLTIAGFLSASTLFSTLFPIQPSQIRTFIDVDAKDSYYEAVMELYERGLVIGDEESAFRPEDNMNRAELLKVLLAARFGAEKVDTTMYEPLFDDVSYDAWYMPSVIFATKAKIVSGYGDGQFRPDQTVTLAEATKMLLGTYGIDAGDSIPTSWYQSYMTTARSKGLYGQMSKTVAEAPITRADFAQFLTNMMALLEEEAHMGTVVEKRDAARGIGTMTTYEDGTQVLDRPEDGYGVVGTHLDDKKLWQVGMYTERYDDKCKIPENFGFDGEPFSQSVNRLYNQDIAGCMIYEDGNGCEFAQNDIREEHIEVDGLAGILRSYYKEEVLEGAVASIPFDLENPYDIDGKLKSYELRLPSSDEDQPLCVEHFEQFLENARISNTSMY